MSDGCPICSYLGVHRRPRICTITSRPGGTTSVLLPGTQCQMAGLCRSNTVLKTAYGYLALEPASSTLVLSHTCQTSWVNLSVISHEIHPGGERMNDGLSHSHSWACLRLTHVCVQSVLLFVHIDTCLCSKCVVVCTH